MTTIDEPISETPDEPVAPVAQDGLSAGLVRRAIDTLGESPTEYQMLDAMMMIQSLEHLAKTYKPVVKAAMIARIKETGKPIPMGEFEWRYSSKKETKCPDVKKGATLILEIAGGDLDKFLGCLSSGALKPGETKTVLKEFKAEERFGEIFEVRYREDVEKELVCVNTKFLK